ncbi:MAG: cysteine hydrolase [Marinilabiliaceae bacterium]|nr:cysteine hydrolase [Marinilabiliaceae bacterium]
MQNKSLVVIDLQNDITKNYKEIIDNVNRSIDWAVENKIHVVYVKHYNLSDGTRTFKPNTRGSELVSDMKMVSDNIFEKSKGNALTSEGFANFIKKNDINQFYIAGADAIACVKSSVFNMCKNNYKVTVLSDCVTSYDTRKIDEMLCYYQKNGSQIMKLNDLLDAK